MTRHKWFIAVALLMITLSGVFLFHRRPEPASAEIIAESSAAPPVDTPAPLRPRQRANAGLPTQAADDLLNHLQLIVHDEFGRPIDGAEVRSSVRAERGAPSLTNFNGTFMTTAHGIADVTWPRAALRSFKVTARKDGFAPRQMVWDPQAGDVIPPVYTLKLTNGLTLGGIIVDPEGRPVPEVSLSFYRFWSGADERPSSRGEDSGFSAEKQTTDEQGRWKATGVPGDLLNRISIDVSHTSYLRTNILLDRKPEVQAALREGTHVLALVRGLEVRGRVIDEHQQPITNAQVWAGRKYYRDRQETRSDAEGRFVFRNISEGTVAFSVMADGFAPDYKLHPVSASATELVFQLARGAVIRGLVQNEVGDPVEGVRVALEGGPSDPAYRYYEFSTKTGSDGRFEWNSAPNEPMPFYIGASDYEQQRGVRLKPNQDNVITLTRNRELVGLVIDAETGQPVKRFSVLPGVGSGGRLGSYSSSDKKEFSSEEGRFTMQLHERNVSAIEVTAHAYFDQLEMLPKAENGRIDVTIRLKPSRPLEGVLLTADGQPVPGAKIGIAEREIGRGISISKGELRAMGRGKLSTTDAEGKFSISPAPEDGTVVATTSNNFASATVAQVRASGKLVLQAYGRIEGVLLRGGQPGAAEELLLSGSASSGLSFDFNGHKTATDASGHFVFEDVPAGTLAIVRLVKISSGSWMHSHRTEVNVMAGQTTSVTLGGTGGTVSGRVRFDGEAPSSSYILHAQLSMPMPRIPEGLTPEQRTAYFQSAEWRELTSQRKSYSGSVSPDGSLLIDSVAPGQYTLRITATEDGDSFQRKQLASGEATVIVPDGAAPNVPINAGEVLLKPSRR